MQDNINKVKIGEELTIQKDFEIECVLSENKIMVKNGDKGFVSSNGFIHYTTGAARGKMQKISFDNFEIKGYDTKNISKLIWNRLSKQFPFDETLEEYEIKESDVLEEIEDILSDIL